MCADSDERMAVRVVNQTGRPCAVSMRIREAPVPRR